MVKSSNLCAALEEEKVALFRQGPTRATGLSVTAAHRKIKRSDKTRAFPQLFKMIINHSYRPSTTTILLLPFFRLLLLTTKNVSGKKKNKKNKKRGGKYNYYKIIIKLRDATTRRSWPKKKFYGNSLPINKSHFCPSSVEPPLPGHFSGQKIKKKIKKKR